MKLSINEIDNFVEQYWTAPYPLNDHHRCTREAIAEWLRGKGY